jgi:hypothetical protein
LGIARHWHKLSMYIRPVITSRRTHGAVATTFCRRDFDDQGRPRQSDRSDSEVGFSESAAVLVRPHRRPLQNQARLPWIQDHSARFRTGSENVFISPSPGPRSLRGGWLGPQTNKRSEFMSGCGARSGSCSHLPPMTLAHFSLNFARLAWRQSDGEWTILRITDLQIADVSDTRPAALACPSAP